MRTFIEILDRRFRETSDRSFQLLERTSDEILFRKPRELDRMFTVFSVGECLVRSAAIVEQTIGGLTSRLWDDPFEWTLTAQLGSRAKLSEYFTEVEETRRGGFKYFASDENLSQTVSAPAGIASIFELLVDALTRANNLQGRAYAIFQVFSDDKLPDE